MLISKIFHQCLKIFINNHKLTEKFSPDWYILLNPIFQESHSHQNNDKIFHRKICVYGNPLINRKKKWKIIITEILSSNVDKSIDACTNKTEQYC